MKKVNKNYIPIFFASALMPFVASSGVFAQPYGTGAYDANVPYGNQTSITISAGNVSIAATASNTGQLSTASGNVVVTSTDVVGYKLYISAIGSTSLTASGATIPASGNVTAAALSTNTWGYNTDASTNFIGLTTTNTLLKSFTGPTTTGDTTAVTYGVKLDFSKQAGSYSTTVLYTAAPQTT
jgi:hypothetical protein